MASGEVITIIREQIQNSWQKKVQMRSKFENVEKNLQTLLHSIGEIDDRQVNGIDISTKKEDLESFLKKYFDITDDDLRTENQKQRFALELKRAQITISLDDIENRIASCNRRMMMTDPELEIFGIDDYDPKSVEAYTKIILLERDLRNLIVNTLEPLDKNWWNELPKDTKTEAEKGFKNEISKFGVTQSMLRKIDFIDFSDYEAIFKGRKTKKIFFGGSDEKQWAIITKLSDLRQLRNKIVHRPPLTDDEFVKFQASHSDLMSFVKELEK